MRILHLTDVYRPAVGGIELFVEELAHRQVSTGDKVDVLTRSRGAWAFDGEVGVIPLGARGPDLRQYDVVHAHLSVFSPLASLYMNRAARAGVPVVGTVHSMWAGRQGIVKSTSAVTGWRRRPPVWTAVSGVAAREVREVLPGADVHVVPNAVDIDYWREDIRSPDQVRRNELPILLAVNRLAPRKRPMAMLQQLHEIKRIAPDAPFRAVIVGAGPLDKAMHAWIDTHGMHRQVQLTGRLSRAEVRDVARRADVFVAPAHQESFGIAALEARAAGVPVVAMKSGGVGEFIEDGREGVLCVDDHDMAQTLARLITDEPYWAEMARHNHEVAPRHDWDQTLAGFRAAYLAAGGPSA